MIGAHNAPLPKVGTENGEMCEVAMCTKAGHSLVHTHDDTSQLIDSPNDTGTESDCRKSLGPPGACECKVMVS